MKLSGAQAIVACLIERGVDTVFGYPGGTVLKLYDALYERSGELRHVRTAHEQGAVHAADGYARSTGRTGVVIATSGPGATNLVTGIATAYLDSVPLVAITGNVALASMGRDSFQEIDICGVTMPITKHNFLVADPAELVSTLREAFGIAESGRRGPVLVDIPKDVAAATLDYYMITEPSQPARPMAPLSELAKAVGMISQSRKPLIYAGGGAVAAEAGEALLAFAEKIRAPVALSLMGLGLIPAGHRLLTGMIGMHGSRASNRAACETDLVISVGARFSDRVTSDAAKFAPAAKIIQLDIDPSEVGKNVRNEIPLLGDLVGNLRYLEERSTRRSRPVWLDTIEGWRSEESIAERLRGPSYPRVVMQAIRKAAGDDAIITTEVGQHQMWAAQYYPFSRPRQFVTSGGLGAMGFGTGAAIGAQIGNPGRRVVHIAGDGSFKMNLTELATIAEHRLPIVIVIMNNGVLGMVHQWQTRFFGSRYSATTLDRSPDFVKLAEAFGIRAWRADSENSLTIALSLAMDEQRPAVIDCIVDEEEEVLPMVPPGRSLDEQIFTA